jgi:hypothetical protein
MTHAHELFMRSRIPKMSLEPLIDQTLPYDARVECICELIADRRIERILAISHYFPSLKELTLFQTARMHNCLGVEVAIKLEENQTWFVLEDPTVGDLSWTIMYVHNLSPYAIRGLVLKYSDAPPGSEGREAFHLVDVGLLRPSEPRVIGVNLFIPTTLFFEGIVPVWSIDIIDAFSDSIDDQKRHEKALF